MIETLKTLERAGHLDHFDGILDSMIAADAEPDRVAALRVLRTGHAVPFVDAAITRAMAGEPPLRSIFDLGAYAD